MASGTGETTDTRIPPDFRTRNDRCCISPPTVSRTISTPFRESSNPLGSIIQNSFSAQGCNVSLIPGGCGRDHTEPGLPGQLDGVTANISCSSMNEDDLPGGYLAIFEQHLPGGDSRNRSRGRFNEI